MKNILPLIGLLVLLNSCKSDPSIPKNPFNVTDFQDDIQYLKDSLSAKHPNLFFHQNQETFFDNLDTIASEDNLAVKTESELLLQLREAVAGLGDPHTNFGFYDLLDEQGFFPIEIFWFEDGIHITGASDAYVNAIGKKLIAINEVPIDEVIARIARVVPKNTPYFAHKRMHYFLPLYALLKHYDVTTGPEANFTLADSNGTIETMKIKLTKGEYNVDLLEHLKGVPDSWVSVQGEEAEMFKYHFFEEDRILFIQYNSCWSRELEERFGDKEEAKTMPYFSEFTNSLFEVIETKDVDKILFDMRFNGGGSSPQGTEFVQELAKIESVNQKGKLFVAISQHSFSSAVINAMNFRQMTNAILIGSPTGGSPNHYGEVRPLILPKTKMEIYHSTKYFQFIDEDLQAVVPDISVPLKFIDVSQGVDTAYEFVKNY